MIAQVKHILNEIKDPEIPILSIKDIGILRDIQIVDDKIIVVITPTYTGCPAMDMIESEIRVALLKNGYTNFEIKKQISPVWTTDWISTDGILALEAYGIAPPKKSTHKLSIIGMSSAINCPKCHSNDTTLINEFGSTACKALYKCNTCHEPFDYFKCI